MSKQLRKAADDLLNTAREFGWCDELGEAGSTVLVNLEQALSQTEEQPFRSSNEAEQKIVSDLLGEAFGVTEASKLPQLSKHAPRCKCGLKSLTGDGCQYCNKDLHIETMEQRIVDLEAELRETEATEATEAQQVPIAKLDVSGSSTGTTLYAHVARALGDGTYPLYTSPQLRRLSDVETDALIVWFEHSPNRSLKALIKGVQVKCGIIKPDAMIKGEEQ